VRHPAGPRLGDEPPDARAAAHLDAGVVTRRSGVHGLGHRPAGVDPAQPFVTRPRCPILDRGRHRRERLDPATARLEQAVGEPGQLLVDDLAHPGEEVVGLMELGDPGAPPRIPRGRRVVGHR
jgi:hypothetical protein